MTVHVSVRSISALLLLGIVLTPEIPLSELQKYVGHYRDAAGAAEFIESTEIGGRMIFQVERVEVGVELAPDTFTLQPSTESGRKQ